MKLSRREFLKEALAALGFSSLPGGVLFAAPSGWKPAGEPNLVFGVLSDTHLRTRSVGVQPGRNWSPRYFAAALEYFRSRNVDAVVHCGDFAHRDQVEEMQYHANYWNKFFPGSKGADGRTVEKLFITGNHDVDGSGYGGFCEKKYPDPVERAKHVLSTDMAANWERIWGEKYEEAWHKTVKGYHFFGLNWGVPGEALVDRIGAAAAAKGPLGTATRPYFVLTHRRPLTGLRHSLSRHPGGISFFGHNHWSVANGNMVYDYGTLAAIQCPSCEPRGCNKIVGDEWITKAKIEGLDKAGYGRQGFVVRLYDDMMVLERHEFTDGARSLGEDWVLPLGNPSHLYSKAEFKKTIGEPQFREGAKLEVGVSRAEPQSRRDRLSHKEQEKKEGSPVASCPLWLKIPLADGNPDSRVYAYEVVVVGEAVGRDDPIAPQTGESGGMGSCRPTKLLKAVYAAGCNMGLGREPDGGVTTLEIPQSELPSGKMLTIAVRPLSSLGTSGKAIATKFKV